jgi:hypothetical protein
MNEQTARNLATRWLEDQNLANDFEVRNIKAYDSLLLAFWDTKDGRLVAGNAPLLIDPAKETIIPTGTAFSMEYYLTNYRITGDPHIVPVKKVKISSGSATANKGSAITTLRNSTALELIEAKHIIDSVLEGNAASILPQNQTEAEAIATHLRHCGFVADVELCPPENKARS